MILSYPLSSLYTLELSLAVDVVSLGGRLGRGLSRLDRNDGGDLVGDGAPGGITFSMPSKDLEGDGGGGRLKGDREACGIVMYNDKSNASLHQYAQCCLRVCLHAAPKTSSKLQTQLQTGFCWSL